MFNNFVVGFTFQMPSSLRDFNDGFNYADFTRSSFDIIPLCNSSNGERGDSTASDQRQLDRHG
jgi:hypothetical protein